jgi:type II secretory pathway pseudopilin PulG
MNTVYKMIFSPPRRRGLPAEAGSESAPAEAKAAAQIPKRDRFGGLRPRRGGNRGISLVEILVAMALIALSIGGIVFVLVQSLGLMTGADNVYASTNIAKNRLERIRQIRNEGGYDTLYGTAESNVIVDRNGIPDQGGDFTRSTTVNPDYGPDLTMITVQVRYKSKGALIAQSIELVTLLSPYT